MIFIIIVLLIIIYIFNYFIMKNINNNIIDNSKNINYIINPSHYKILKKIDYYDKFITTKILLKNININDRIFNLYKKIKNKINKNIVYGIKKKDNIYRLELYIYKKELSNNLNNLNYYKEMSNENLLNNVLILLSLIDNTLDIENIKKKLELLLLKYKINIFSFDINLDNSFYNNKIHIYTSLYNNNNNNYYSYTYEYDFINDILILESNYFNFKNYDELYDYLDKNNNINCNINDIINELKDIGPKCESINFHHKYYNNSFGLYLINNDFIYLKKFLKKYNYKKINIDDEKLFNNLNFDFVINYSYDNCKINGTGFSDIF